MANTSDKEKITTPAGNLYRIQRKRQQAIIDEFLKQYAFFAFNEQQFDDGMKKLNIEDGQRGRIVSIGCGGYILKERKNDLARMLKSFSDERRAAWSDPASGPEFAFDMFYTELANHEYSYTGDPWEAVEALGIDADDIDHDPVLKEALQAACKALMSEKADDDTAYIVEKLTGLEDQIYSRYGVTSRPTDDAAMLRDLAEEITETGLAGQITPAVLERLTAGNFHLVKQAAELATSQ